LLTVASLPGTTNFVQAMTAPDGSVAPATSIDVSEAIEILGSSIVVTNWTELRSATNWPARYYRIRAVQMSRALRDLELLSSKVAGV